MFVAQVATLLIKLSALITGLTIVVKITFTKYHFETLFEVCWAKSRS